LSIAPILQGLNLLLEVIHYDLILIKAFSSERSLLLVRKSSMPTHAVKNVSVNVLICVNYSSFTWLYSNV